MEGDRQDSAWINELTPVTKAILDANLDTVRQGLELQIDAMKVRYKAEHMEHELHIKILETRIDRLTLELQLRIDKFQLQIDQQKRVGIIDRLSKVFKDLLSKGFAVKK